MEELSTKSYEVIQEIYEKFKDKYSIEFVLSFHANTEKIPQKGIATDQDFINVAKEIDEPDSIFIHFVDDDNMKKIEMLKDEDFKELMNRHKYFKVYNSPYAEEGRIYIEPEFPIEMTDWVKKECGNIVYHITADINADTILNNGITLCNKQKKHNNKLQTRQYSKNKAFFVAVKNNENVEDVLNTVSQEFFAFYKENPIYLKIDLNEANGVRLYKDTAMNNTNNENTYSVFSLENIPMECVSISDIKPAELKYYEDEDENGSK